MNKWILFFTMLPALLFADQPSTSTESQILESVYTPLATLHGAPETNIYGVNVINGDYNYSAIDFNLPGTDPLVLQRTYSSSNFKCRAFFHSWTHNLSGLVRHYFSDIHLHVIVSGSLSGELPFRKKIKKKGRAKINKEILEKGVTNYGHGEISGRTNLKNMEVDYWLDAVNVINSDGTQHDYYRLKDHFGLYTRLNYLRETTKPNGRVTKYDADGYNKLDLISDRKLFNFSVAALEHMNDPARIIPIQTLETIIKHPQAITKDPRKASNALMYYSQMTKNGKLYNTEVLYEAASNKILHFKYAEKPMGPLKGVK